MGTYQAPTTGPVSGKAAGFWPFRCEISAINRSAATAVGTVMVMDFANSDAAVSDNNLDGGDNSGFSNVVVAATGVGASDPKAQAGAIFCLSLGVTATDTVGQFMLYGHGEAIADGNANAIVIGDPLICDLASPGLLLPILAGTTVAESSKIIGHALEATTSATGLINVLFDGVSGLGTFHDSTA